MQAIGDIMLLDIPERVTYTLGSGGIDKFIEDQKSVISQRSAQVLPLPSRPQKSHLVVPIVRDSRWIAQSVLRQHALCSVSTRFAVVAAATISECACWHAGTDWQGSGSARSRSSTGGQNGLWRRQWQRSHPLTHSTPKTTTI